MPTYPTEQFKLREDEVALFQAIQGLMQAKLHELAENHIFSLSQCQRGNATLAAFESWCGEDGYGMRKHRELDELSKRLRMAVNKARNRARSVLSKRIRKNPHDTRKAKAA